MFRFKPVCRSSIVLSAALLLGGCFASDRPLIDPAGADTPIADGSKFVESLNCDSDVGKLIGCTGYRHVGSATLMLHDRVYNVHPDPNDSPLVNTQLKAGQTKQNSFVMKKIGGDLYVIQIPVGDAGPPEAKYLYELIRLTGDTGYFYTLMCEENGDTAYVHSGALTRISPVMLVPTCQPASFEGLSKVMADRIANGAIPDEKLDIQPPG